MAVMAGLCIATVFAEEITADQAKQAVATWTQRSSRKTFGGVCSVSPLTDETSGAKFHVVKLEGGGYVVTTSDNRVSPVVAYSDTDDFPTDPDNPLVQILKHDAMAIQQELEKASSNVVAKSARNMLMASSTAAVAVPSVVDDEFSAARNEWAELLGEEDTNEQSRPMKARLLSAAVPNTANSIDSQVEVYVPAILETKWGQTTHNNSSKGLPCYNYFTPLISDPKVKKADSEKSGDLLSGDILETNETTRVPCGCVATAAAQLMYKWKHPSRFAYANMVHDTRWHSSETIRVAIGSLTYSVANTCNADWGTIAAGGTSMFTSEMVEKLRTSYGYASTTWVGSPSMKSSSGELSEFNELVVPNLIANHPVILDITKGKGGHCVVADGLDMDGTTCRLHINLGWNGSYDSYYTPPSIRGYTSVRGIGINIMPHQSGAIVAGVVVDNDSVPLSQVKVTLAGSTKHTDSHGRYSFIVPSGTYTIVAEKGTLSNIAQATVKYSTGSGIKNAYVPIRLSAPNLTRTSAPVVTHTFDSSGQAIVTISADSGALITYTTDGTTPTDDFEESIPYNLPFTINGAGFRLIRARAFKEGFADSYTTDYRIPFPTSSNNGNFSSSKCITTSSGATLLNNISAGRESGEPVHSVVGNAGGSSVWVSFVAPDDADYTFTAKGSNSASDTKGSETDEESVLDTQLAVYTGDKLSNLGLVAANDDVDAAEFDFSSRVAFHAVKGRTYHIAVDTQYGEKGVIQLEWMEGREDVASPVDYDVFYDGEERSRSIQIRSTADWFVVDCSDWIVLNKSSGADGESIVFTTPELANDTYRTGTILVQAGEGAYSTIRVTQSPAKWYTNKTEAFEAAEALGKRVLMVCGRDSCPNTTYVRLTACENDSVKPILTSDYVLWYCDCDKQISDYADYEQGLGGYTLPLVCIINPETANKYIARRTGYATPAQLLEFLEGNSEGLLPSLPIGVSASCSTNPAGITVGWGKARRAQSYEIWRGEKWNPDLAECIGETTSDTEFLDESVALGVLYYYRVRAVNAVGAGDFSEVATGCYREDPDAESAAIGNALGAPHLDWVTEGDYPWTVQGTNTYDGVGAMQSAFVDPKQSGVTSVLKTTVTGPTRMSFRYKTRMYSSRFAVTIDGAEAFLVTGAVGDWTLAEVEIPDGEHEVAFSYAKSGYYTSGFNGVYLDTVQFDVLSTSPTLTPATTDDEDTALTFSGTMEVSIAAPEGSDIFYTIDGSDPTRLSPQYYGPFSINASTHVKAICIQDGYDCSAPVSGLYLERHPVQAGEWTTDVEGAKKAALKNGSIIVTLLGNYETCGYTRSFAAVAESADFLAWAKANGVYLITADSSRWIDTNAAYSRFWDLFYDAGQSGSVYYPALAIANAWAPDVATGYAVARSGQSIGGVLYGGTISSLESGLQSFFSTRPANAYVWIAFDGNGGTPYEKSLVGISGQAIGDLPSAYRKYHYFDGWYTSPEGGTKISEKTVLDGDEVYYAHWNPYSYRVQFDANGGSVSPNYKYVSYGMAYGDLPSPTRTGTDYVYTFDGWYTAANGGKKITAEEIVTITSGQTLYAHWSAVFVPTTYTITYNPGAYGIGLQQFAEKTNNVALTLADARYTRTGYMQTGWATSDGGAKAYDLGAPYTANVAASFYPFWAASTYTVTLDHQGGSGGTESVTATYDVAMPSIVVPQRVGHVFCGYYTAVDGAGIRYYTASGLSAQKWNGTGATTLYAKWRNIDDLTGVQFVMSEIDVGEDGSAEIRVIGGNADKASSVNVYLTYNTAAAADVDLAKGTMDGVTPKGGLKFPLTLSWAEGEVGEKVVTIPTKTDKAVEGDEFFTLQLAEPVGMELGEERVCTVTIHDPGYDDLEAKIKSDTATKAEQTAWDKLQNAGAPHVRGIADPANAGKVTGSGLCADGKKVTLNASANKGFVFVGWTTEQIPLDGDRLVIGAHDYVATTPSLVVDRSAKPAKDTATSTTIAGAAEDATYYANFITVDEDSAAVTLAVDGLDIAADPEFAAYQGALSTNVMAGVALSWQLVADALTATTIKVAGLPAGLKFTDKPVTSKVGTGASAVTVTNVPANTIYGAPSTASTVDKKTGLPKPSEVKITVTTAGKSSVTYLVKLTVDPLPGWAVGTFDGEVEGGGIVQAFTVATNGKISGKILKSGSIWALSAASFDMVEGSSFIATVIGKSGKEIVTNEVAVASAVVDDVEFGMASSYGWSAWQNLWSRPDTKAEMPVFRKSFDVTLESGLKLTFKKNGAVSFAGKVEGVSVSGSSQLVCDGDAWKVTLYAPPKGAFKGFSETFAVILAVDEANAVTDVDVAEWQ